MTVSHRAVIVGSLLPTSKGRVDIMARMEYSRLKPVAVRSCRRGCLNAHHAALTAALYTIWSSVVVILVYLWRMVVNAREPHHLQDLYYGVQISYVSSVVTHLILIVLSVFLILGIQQERCGLVTPWVVASIAFMALEAFCCVYSSVLRDHINKKFDFTCKAEMSFFLMRVAFHILALWPVTRFLRHLQAGLTYKDPEAIDL
ncbi:uncharacterized protein [Panulirus ornatus]|uniref:uncharacterized protein n=1 Tax=Panulirus ornatus TaxID=150431 RepID=UPI003A8B7FE3